ncbi:MAG: antioxidant AhpC [Lysobacterales bacterium CG_4_9_14_3_um_filter_62_6]|nr:MAG: antioxidant AhpC [Xanthomonadales bacterium CG_4_9_14_3_um_filter_62_6]
MLRSRWVVWLALAMVLSSLGFSSVAPAEELAPSATAIRPILLGSAVPEVPLKTVAGESVSLSQQIAGKPTVLVFYRGGWCPFCNLQLSELRLIEKDLALAGYQMIAISPDRPEELRRTLDKHQLSYTLLSDSKAAALKAFGIGFVLDAATTEKYAGHGIDIDHASGETHHALPVPSVFIVDAEGRLQFEYVHPDYRIRVPGDVVLAAARSIAKRKHILSPQP